MQKEQIIEALRHRWIKEYADMANAGTGLRDGYFVTGFVSSVLSEIESEEKTKAILQAELNARGQQVGGICPEGKGQPAPPDQTEQKPDPYQEDAIRLSHRDLIEKSKSIIRGLLPQGPYIQISIPAAFLSVFAELTYRFEKVFRDGIKAQQESQQKAPAPADQCTPRPDSGVKCPLTNDDLVLRCAEWVDCLCKSDGKAWALSVPSSSNDPDSLFKELIERFKSAKAEIERLYQQNDKLRERIVDMSEFINRHHRYDKTREERIIVDMNVKLRQSDELIKRMTEVLPCDYAHTVSIDRLQKINKVLEEAREHIRQSPFVKAPRKPFS